MNITGLNIHTKETPITTFTEKHETFIYETLTAVKESPSQVFRRVFNVNKDTKHNTVVKRINQTVAHEKAKELIASFQEAQRERLLERVTITKEQLIEKFLRIHDKCMEDAPVLGIKGNHIHTLNEHYDPLNPREDIKRVGVYTFKPQGAIKALENVKQLLGFDVKEVNINHKATIMQEVTKGLNRELPINANADDKQRVIEDAEFSIEELEAEIEADEQAMEAERNKSSQAGDNKDLGTPTPIEGGTP